jgi:hypothetical protein
MDEVKNVGLPGVDFRILDSHSRDREATEGDTSGCSKGLGDPSKDGAHREEEECAGHLLRAERRSAHVRKPQRIRNCLDGFPQPAFAPSSRRLIRTPRFAARSLSSSPGATSGWLQARSPTAHMNDCGLMNRSGPRKWPLNRACSFS